MTDVVLQQRDTDVLQALCEDRAECGPGVTRKELEQIAATRWLDRVLRRLREAGHVIGSVGIDERYQLGEPSNGDSACEIPLRSRSGELRAVAVVDAQDFEKLGHLAWHLSDGCVARSTPRVEGKRRTVKLHRAIVGVTDPRVQVDHIDCDFLNNRRSNLRVASHGENQQNRTGTTSRNRAGYRGVSWDPVRKMWRAYSKLESVGYHLGRYDDLLDAARAAEAFRREHMPFAKPDATLEPVPQCPCQGCKGQLFTLPSEPHWRERAA